MRRNATQQQIGVGDGGGQIGGDIAERNKDIRPSVPIYLCTADRLEWCKSATRSVVQSDCVAGVGQRDRRGNTSWAGTDNCDPPNGPCQGVILF
jgi:hypothetical protein